MFEQKEIDTYKEVCCPNVLLITNGIDLTEDTITEPLILQIDGERHLLLETVGMKAPCRYSEFIRNWTKQRISPENRETFAGSFCREELLRRFGNGEACVQIDYKSGAEALLDTNEKRFLRHVLFMKSSDAGHVMLGDIVQDVTDQIVQQQKLYHELENERAERQQMQYIDPLTGYLNKQGFLKQMQKELKQNPDCQYALCYSDVSNLSFVNSIYGYDVGNRLLQVWSSYIHENLKSGEQLGRISGDYFAVLVKVPDHAATLKLQKDLDIVLNYVNQFFQEEYPHFHVDIYTGAYLITREDRETVSLERMLNRASIAQKSAKDQNDKTIRFYNPEQWDKRSRLIRISQNLEDAIAGGSIIPWFQPQYDYESGRLVGAEVLCRWNDPVLGWISPSEFIPALENTGQIYMLDTYIWEKACECIRRWTGKGKSLAVPLSVNISRYDIQQEDFLDRIFGLLDHYGLTPDMLRLEITESAYMEEPEALIRAVSNLRNRGFAVEMDDFGSGYSSLSMLKEVPVDTLKMDLHFLSETNVDKRGGSIVSSVIRMAQGLNIAVIAEGVETAAQAESLKSMGCSVMQGYYLGRPMPLEKFEKICKKSLSGRRTKQNENGNLTYIYDIMDSKSKSSYIFNHYSSAEAIVEFDGEHMEIMSVNDQFLRVIGDRDGIVRNNMKNGLGLVSDEHKPMAIEALHRAVRDGQAECEMYLSATGQWVNVTYRHVLKSRTVDYLFCEAVNTSEKHEIFDRMRTIMDEVSLAPAGIFRYSADGAQEFTFISDGLLTLLDYPSEEVFRAKFHNCFPDMVYHEDRSRVLREIDEQIAVTGSLDYCEYRIETGSGQLKWVYDHGHLVTDEDGKRWFYVVIADLDQVKRRRQEQDWQAKKYQTLAMIPGTNTFDYDLETGTLHMNRTRSNGETESFSLCDFLERMETEGWADPETAKRMRRMIETAAAAPVQGSLPYEGQIRGVCFRKGVCYYASIPDENGKICGIVGNITGAEEGECIR